MNSLKRINLPNFTSRRISTSTGALNDHQAHPLSGYYRLLLESPVTPNLLPPASAITQPPPISAASTAAANKARVAFGSLLAGPTERREEAKRKGGKRVAGVWVPPKPVEPDDCCMSGCVNCTWDVFREDLEEWKSAEGRARVALAKTTGVDGDGHDHGVGDGDEAGSKDGGLWEGFEDIPVGIRAFMEMEKRLKEKRA